MASLENVIFAIDSLEMGCFWQLALSEPIGILRKISDRKIEKKWIVSLHSFIKGMDRDKLKTNKSFFLLVENLYSVEIGSGLFIKGKKEI